MNLPKYPQIRIKYEISAPIIVIKNRTQIFDKEALGKKAVFFGDTTSKIDCFLSAANVIASQQAVEKAFEISPSKQTVVIRDLILKLEMAYSHLNHLSKRIIPRLYGFNNYFEFIKKHEKEHIKNNELLLKLEKILVIISKRYPMPINTVVGGHLATINDDEKKEIIIGLKELLPPVVKTIEFLLKHQKPTLDIIDKYQSLWDLDSTPLIIGDIKINDDEPKTPIDHYSGFDAEKSAFVGPADTNPA